MSIFFTPIFGGIWKKSVIVFTTLAVLAPVSGRANPQQPEPRHYLQSGRTSISFSDRVWAQTQIERVYYSHRIWPNENPGPKPPFEQMVPVRDIRHAVRATLKKNRKLSGRLDSPISDEDLQIELNRQVSTTQSPLVLSELYTALLNDPFLIANTLALASVVNYRYLEAVQARRTRGHQDDGDDHEGDEDGDDSADDEALAASANHSLAATLLSPFHILPIVTDSCKRGSPCAVRLRTDDPARQQFLRALR